MKLFLDAGMEIKVRSNTGRAKAEESSEELKHGLPRIEDGFEVATGEGVEPSFFDYRSSAVGLCYAARVDPEAEKHFKQALNAVGDFLP